MVLSEKQRKYIREYMRKRRQDPEFRKRQIELQYDTCPRCGGRKTKRSKLCRKCENERRRVY